jgi:hypothetical protein
MICRMTRVALLGFVLGSCASAHDPNVTPEASEVINVQKDSQEAYRSFREYAKRCQEAHLGSGVTLDGEFRPDLKRGEVRIYNVDLFGPPHVFRIEFEPVGPKASRMIVRTKLLTLLASLESKFEDAANGVRDC